MRVSRYVYSILRYGLISLGTLLLVLLLLTAAVYYVAVSDQERVPAWVEGYSREELGVEATFKHYRFQYFEHFPFLSLALEDIVLRSPDSLTAQTELLRVKEVDIVFRPWKLLQEKYELRSIRIDTARLQLYRNAKGQFNAAALRPDSSSVHTDNSRLLDGLFQLKTFSINGFYLDFLDSLRRKHHRLEMLDSDLQWYTSDTARHIGVLGQWKFHGLVFKMKNGPFFEQQLAEVDLDFSFPFSKKQITLSPSAIRLKKDTLRVEGYYKTEAPGFLRLDVRADHLLLADAKPLLANNLQQALAPYKIDAPLQVQLSIEGATPPGKRQPLQLDISGENLTLATNTLRFTAPKLQAHYRNDCDSSGTITPYTDCLEVVLDSALLFGSIPVRDLVYFDQNLQHPHATFSGRTRVALQKLNAYLPGNTVRLDDGWMDVQVQFAGQPDDLIDPTIKTLRPQFSASGHIRDAKGEYRPSQTVFEDMNLSFSLNPHRLYLQNARITANGQQLQLSGPVYGLPALLFSKPAALFAKLRLSAGDLELDRLIGSGSTKGLALSSNRPFRLAVDFRADRLSYRKIRLQQARFQSEYHAPCAPGDTCLRITQLQGRAYQQLPIRGRAAITDWPRPQADLQLQMDVPLAEVQPLLPKGQVDVQAGSLSLSLRYRGGLLDYADFSDAALNAPFRGAARIQNASADYLPKGYRFRDINARLRFNEEYVVIDTLEGQLNGNTALASGYLHGLLPFIFGVDQHKLQAALLLRGQKIDLNTFSNAPLPGAALEAEAESPFEERFTQLMARLKGRLAVRADTLLYRGMELSAVAFRSTIGPECDGAETCIIVDSLRARLFGSTTIQARLQARQLHDPFLSADVRASVPMQKLNRMFSPDQLKFGQGRISLAFRYEGQPHKHFDLEQTLLKAKIQGQGEIQQADFTYQPRGYDFEQVQAAFGFDGQDLRFDNLDVLLNGNRLRGSGIIRDFLPFIFFPERKLDASLQVHAERFDLNQFKAPEKFQSDTTGQPEQPTVVTRLVNASLDSIKTDFDLRLDTVLYRNFTGYDVEGEVFMGGGELAFKRTNMKLAGGQFALRGEVSGLRKNQPQLDLTAQVKETDIKQFFEAFDNFGQQSLTAENLEGKLSGELSFRAHANANYELAPNSMQGKFELQVEDGSLINLSALDSIRNILFRNRDLSHIEFATLENTFLLDGQDLYIGHFYVPSSVLTFSASGRYSLADDQRTNLLFEIPWANLFRKDISRQALGNMKAEAKTGPSILIRAKGKADGLEFKWVLSRKE
jgi:uncharacterized protein involved in outer membrane biogenesis